MERIALLLVAVAMLAGVVVGLAQTSKGSDAEPAPRSVAESAPQSAKQVRGATPYIEIKDEPAPKLIVDEPLPDGLPHGIIWIQYRTENCRILPLFGKEALTVSPRVGQPACAGRRPFLVMGRHKRQQHGRHRRDAAGRAQSEDRVGGPNASGLPQQSKTVKFTVPKTASPVH